MPLESIRITPCLANRGRTIALSALVALACSACASEETVSTVPNGGMPPMMSDSNEPTNRVASTATLSYPPPNNGPAESASSSSVYSPTYNR